MRITKESLKMYWKNFNRAVDGDWSPGFAVAFISGALMFVFLMFFLLFVVLYLLLEHTVIFLPLLFVFTLVRLGYAAVKGK